FFEDGAHADGERGGRRRGGVGGVFRVGDGEHLVHGGAKHGLRVGRGGGRRRRRRGRRGRGRGGEDEGGGRGEREEEGERPAAHAAGYEEGAGGRKRDEGVAAPVVGPVADRAARPAVGPTVYRSGKLLARFHFLSGGGACTEPK